MSQSESSIDTKPHRLHEMGLASGVTHFCFGVCIALLLYAAAGPIATDDVWWHLELGSLYRDAGPWLDADPRLHTANGPPAPNAWLFDLGLAGLVELGGLYALRALHASCAGLAVALVWRALARRAASAWIASLGTTLFVACSSYRLLQLRPELATILATLVLYSLVLEPERPSGRRLAGATLLCGLWANLHPGFLIGPVLMLSAAVSVAAAAGLTSGPAAARHASRALRLATAGAAGLLATGLNPDGFSALAAYGSAGVEAASAGLVIDEWRPLALLSWPQSNLPPTPLAWACSWLLLPPTLWLIGSELSRRLRARRAEVESGDRIDPGLLALAAIGALAPWVAVRFLWLSVFPLLLIAARLREAIERPRLARPWLGAISALALLVGYAELSAWTLLAPRSERGDTWSAYATNYAINHATNYTTTYANAYDADRYYAHSVWFLRDTGVEGRLFNPYFMGGFLEYWLAPKLAAFADGSLNFPEAVLRDHALILAHGAGEPDFELEALLDGYGIDFFVGVGLPTAPPPGRPWRYSTHHLERSARWIPVYRSLDSAVYLRRADRNQQNLDRISAYYDRAGVPFDRERGLDVAGALDRATAWSIEHGLAPIDLPELVTASQRAAPRLRAIALRRLASTHAALGLYRSAIEIDSRSDPSAATIRPDGGRERRLAWSFMRLDRDAEALAHAERIPRRAGGAPPALLLRVREYVAATSPSERARLAAMTPLFSRREAGQLKHVERTAPARLR